MRGDIIKQPSLKQRFILRLMIVIGVCSIAFFLHSELKPQIIGYKPLYYLLITTFIFTFFKVICEWYHYWSITVPVQPPATKQYSVDIFTTFVAGEPYDMIVSTLMACQAIKYPHETYLCDEADDEYLKQICEELGVHHVTRTIKIDAKAGNINNALRQSKGELCVVLDPDHIPVPEFLDAIVSFFDNPEIGYVQVVQAYYNQDAGWIAKGAAQQTYQYYGPMMMTMNSYGTVQAIGANCTFRRTALDSIGGHAAGLAEDMHTAMQLHAKGWKSVYVPKVLSRGLVPATLSAYYKQQLKWSRGVFELFVTSYFKLFKSFTWRQKLHYGLVPVFYLSGFIFLLNFLIPIISLFADVYPLRMDFTDFLLVSIPFITSVILIRHYVQQWVMEDRERGFQVVGGLLLIGTWWVFILGFIYTVARKKVPYLPTPKGTEEENNLTLNLPNIAILLVSVLAIIYAFYNDWNPFTIFMAGIVGLNCLFMIFMLAASKELKFKDSLKGHNSFFAFAKKIKILKSYFWLFRRRVYTGIRSICLMLFVLIICGTLYTSINHDDNYHIFSTWYQIKSVFPSISQKKPFVNNEHLPSVNDLKDYEIQELLFEKPTYSKTNDTSVYINAHHLQPNIFLSTHGVIYGKAQYWYQNRYLLNKQVIERDFAEIAQAGINTVKIYGPNVYDRLTFNAARKQNLKIVYSFWIPDPSYFVNNADYLNDLEQGILKAVVNNKSNTTITSWNIGNSTIQQLNNYYHGQQLLYAQVKYIQWLKQLVQHIKNLDPNRSVSIDILLSPSVDKFLTVLHNKIPEIDAFGLVVNSKSTLNVKLPELKALYFFSSVNPTAFPAMSYVTGGIFYANWQDQQAGAKVTFDGLKDIWGRNKPILSKISKVWHGNIAQNYLPSVKILRPALNTSAGTSLQYNALVYLYNKWNLAAYLPSGINFEWYLVKIDKDGKPIDLSYIGSGPTTSITMPANTSQYKLYLVAVKGNNTTDDYSTLNTPLKN